MDWPTPSMDIPTLIALLAIGLLWFLHRYRTFYSKLPPGPWGLPLLGYLPFLKPRNTYLQLHEMGKRYGPIYSVQLGQLFAVVLCDAGLVKEAFSREEFNYRADLYVTHGIMDGCVGPKRDLMERRIFVGVENLLSMIEATSGTAVDPHHIFLHTVGNVINDFLFGRTWEENDEKWAWLLSLAEEGIKHVGVAGPVNFLPFLRLTSSRPARGACAKLPLHSCDAQEENSEFIDWKKIEMESEYEKQAPHSTRLHTLLTNSFQGYLEEVGSITEMITRGACAKLPLLSCDAQEENSEFIDWKKIEMESEYEKQAPHRCTLYSQTVSKDISKKLGQSPVLMAKLLGVKTTSAPSPPRRRHSQTLLLRPTGTYITAPNPCRHTAECWTCYGEKQKAFERVETYVTAPELETVLSPFPGKRMCMGGELARMIATLFLSNLIKQYRVTYESEEEILAARQGEFGLTLQPEASTYGKATTPPLLPPKVRGLRVHSIKVNPNGLPRLRSWIRPLPMAKRQPRPPPLLPPKVRGLRVHSIKVNPNGLPRLRSWVKNSVLTDFQDTLRAEITSKSSGTRVTLDDITSMSYLAACINETHRYRTIVTLGIPHSNRVPTNIGGYLIPANTMVIPFLYSIHMNGEAHQEPHRFDPGRFLQDKLPAQFMPFQVGKRMCMGGELARMIATLFLSNLIKQYRVTYESEEEILAARQGEFGLTLQPGPHKLRFTRI
ncbi:cytochrome P450 18a1-like [Diaphorina citri]|uniref:Cytochrome P450 18a1-like n=1 Tax=Diaphorina citri TaxID=121845 RepID=A0A1S4EGR9_DIACI|nr:cytochrome P450 18a1-like [Diaphorina citri]